MTMANIFFRMTNHECLTTNHESRPVQTAEDLVELLNRNRSADVNERRTVRRRLRALHGVKVHFEVSWWTRRTVADGTRTVTVTDSEGNTTTHEETVYSTIDVELFFANGILGVAFFGDDQKDYEEENDNDDRDEEEQAEESAEEKRHKTWTHKHGFDVTVSYHDGHGQARKRKFCRGSSQTSIVRSSCRSHT